MLVETAATIGAIVYLYLVLESDSSLERAESHRYDQDLESLRGGLSG